MKGRNNNGHITSINRAGGHKKMYRHVDFYRKKFDMAATVERIEYDPNRSCYIMLVKFEIILMLIIWLHKKLKLVIKLKMDQKKKLKLEIVCLYRIFQLELIFIMLKFNLVLVEK